MFLACFEKINCEIFFDYKMVNIYCIVCEPVVTTLINIDDNFREVSMPLCTVIWDSCICRRFRWNVIDDFDGT